MSDLLLSADDTESVNFQRACDQIRQERGAKAAADFAFRFGYLHNGWTGSSDTLMERAADLAGYRVDWHGADGD